MESKHTPRRPIKSEARLVAVSWTVQEGTHFPKRFGPFHSEAEARACVDEHPHARTMFVSEWATEPDTGSAA